MKTEIVKHVPSGVFRGSNCVTPEILEYRKGNLRGYRVYIEISKGIGPITGEQIFGVTIRRVDGQMLDPDPGHCMYSLAMAHHYIEELK